MEHARSEFDFFIAHAAKDLRNAERLYSLLEGRAKVFLAGKIRLGRNWDLAVRDAQMRAAVTVILVSKATDEAFYQREEIARAIAHARETPSRHTVIPVFLNKIQDLGSSLPYGLATVQGLTISRSVTMEDVSNRLMDELSQIVSEREDSSSHRTDETAISDQYGVDLCLCVDVGPEAGGFMEGILREIVKFPYLLMGHMSTEGQQIRQLRVRILTFGAYVDLAAMRDSDTGFLEYPQDAAEVTEQAQNLLRSRRPVIRSRALVALEKAIRSRWCNTFPRVLHVIAIWSACAPQADTASLDQLKELWEDHGSTGLSPAGKRLAVFAPQSEAWEYISSNFENAVWHVGAPGRTKPDISDDIMKALTMDITPEQRPDEREGRLSVHCIHALVSPDELRRQVSAGGRQTLTERKHWVTGSRLLANAKRSNERMPILFSGLDGRDSLIYWAIIDDITIDARTGTTCSYSELREIRPARQRSELRLRKAERHLSDNSARSYTICYTPGFLAQGQSPNAT